MIFDLIKSSSAEQVPFIKHVGLTVSEVGSGFATAQLPDHQHTKNHINTVHAAAIYMLCESASGAATAGAFGNVFMMSRPVVRDAKISYLKAGRGVIEAKAVVDGQPEELLQVLQDTGNVDFQVNVEARSDEGSLVAKAIFYWNIKTGEKK
jgi:acyl-coenzyme A thioesterase PaaI-like protein